jgi:hypothetical protein
MDLYEEVPESSARRPPPPPSKPSVAID